MRVPFLAARKPGWVLEPLTDAHATVLSALHREDFSRPWSEDEFSGLLAQAAVFGYGAREIGKGEAAPVGFVLARVAADEGEILTVAVARSHRRLGLGWQLLDAVLRELHRRRAEALYLEVDERNLAAIALYRRLGFFEVGRRPDYYAVPGAGNALVMRRDLGSAR